jgi:hypothetical protein
MRISELPGPSAFAEILLARMTAINPGIEDMELYEFRYCLDNLVPDNHRWDSVELLDRDKVEEWIQHPGFFTDIQVKPQVNGRIVLDETIARLTRMLFVGLVTGEYPVRAFTLTSGGSSF